MAYEDLFLSPWFLAIFLIVIVWELIWKGIGLWKSGKNNQVAWFVCIFIFNTIGILPILYLLFFQKKKVQKVKSEKVKKRKLKK
ncbi:MAG: DUF5652 family protein [Nanoarchaeota archaeon]|nr:DUF5652 family protein [Nanoarchaeota archaeon]